MISHGGSDDVDEDRPAEGADQDEERDDVERRNTLRALEGGSPMSTYSSDSSTLCVPSPIDGPGDTQIKTVVVLAKDGESEVQEIQIQWDHDPDHGLRPDSVPFPSPSPKRHSFLDMSDGPERPPRSSIGLSLGTGIRKGLGLGSRVSTAMGRTSRGSLDIDVDQALGRAEGEREVRLSHVFGPRAMGSIPRRPSESSSRSTSGVSRDDGQSVYHDAVEEWGRVSDE